MPSQGQSARISVATVERIEWLKLAVLGCLLLLLSLDIPVSAYTLEDDYIRLPAEFAARVPARLVFTPQELAACWRDDTARRCVLKGPINLDQNVWQQAFQDTGGIAELNDREQPFTITSEPCTAAGTCLPGSGAVYTIRFNRLANSMFLRSGSVLRFSNVQLFDLAPQGAYVYSTSQPYRSSGQGTTTWPSIALEPNATLVLYNSSILYFNPSDTDDCVSYTQKRIFAFRQVWGESNISQVNATSNVVIGPQIIRVTIRNGSTDAVVGNATVVYTNVTFTCMDNTTDVATSGISSGALAAAIAVPVGVVLLAGGLLLLCCFRSRRRRRLQQRAATPVIDKDAAALALMGDVEAGQGSGLSLGDAPDGNRARDQVKLVPREQKGDSFSSSKDVGHDPSCSLQLAVLQGGAVAPTAEHAYAAQHDPPQLPDAGASAPASIRLESHALPGSEAYQDSTSVRGSGGVVGSGGLPGSDMVLSNSGLQGSGGGVQGSGGTYDGGSTFSTGVQSQRFTGSASFGSRAAGMDDRLSSVSALLKARSDVAVLRDLKIGPLLGRGSYGRVYRGRWKATPVAVKIIEHHTAGACSSGGKTVSAGRETLLATSVSHPNVVTTYHISTMSMSQRSALASSWLDGGGAASSSQLVGQQLEDSRDEDDSDGSTISSDLDESPPDLLETWIIMEFCEKGSLERAVRLGKFKRSTAGHGEMVGVYKALLDTASGLDYLHSIGVVHGDLKTANVLLKGSTRNARGVTCKISDFGLSRVLDPEATHISTCTYGTIVYMPKELLLSGRMTQATDIYSFGLMMWELFTGQPVMEEGLSIGQMFYMIAYEGWRPQLPEDCPQGYADLMTACWHEDPEQRPTGQQLLRRLQKMYVQAKQQFLATRPGTSQQAGRAGAGASRPHAPAARAFPSGESLEESYSPTAAAVAAAQMGNAGGAAAAAASPPVHDQEVQNYLEQLQQHPVRQRSLQAPVGTAVSARLTSSVEEGSSIDMPAPAPGRPSNSSSGPEEPDGYQPYVQAVLQRSTSVSSPVLGRPITPRPLGGAAGDAPSSPRQAVLQQPGQLAQLQEQLAQLQQDPEAQQQVLQQYAVFVPPMLPVDVSGGVAGPSFYNQQGAGDEAGLFDEDGMASESLLRQLTSPSNAMYAVEPEEQYSGFMHATSAGGQQQQQQSMQQAVELYRQQLQYLQQQSAGQHAS